MRGGLKSDHHRERGDKIRVRELGDHLLVVLPATLERVMNDAGPDAIHTVLCWVDGALNHVNAGHGV